MKNPETSDRKKNVNKQIREEVLWEAGVSLWILSFLQACGAVRTSGD